MGHGAGYGSSRTSSSVSTSAFGEATVAENTPQVQIKFPYGLNSDVVQSLTNGASSAVTTSNGLCTITCDSAANSFSQIRSIEPLRYGPGQGALTRYTAKYTTGVANSTQVAGPGDDDEGLFFGYNGTSFGVLHRRFGELEIRKLTITAGADGTGGTFDIVLDGDTVTVTVAANDTISEVCAAIVAETANVFNAGRGWEVVTDDNISVEFISLVAENAAGTFSFTDVDSGVTAGTFEQATTKVAGVAPTETWIAQTAWNEDLMDGTGPSGMTLDPTKLNVFQVQFQYLGAGGLCFFVEDPETTRLVLVHIIKFANANTVASLRNPTMPLTIIIKTEAGYSGGALAVSTASLAAFIEGDEGDLGVRHGADNAKATTGTTPVCVLLLSNALDFQGTRNKVEVFPDILTLSNEATKTVTFRILRDPTHVGGTATLSDVNASTSVIKKATAGTTVVGGEPIFLMKLGGGLSETIRLTGSHLDIRPGERWAITAELSSGSNAEASVAVTWTERI